MCRMAACIRAQPERVVWVHTAACSSHVLEGTACCYNQWAVRAYHVAGTICGYPLGAQAGQPAGGGASGASHQATAAVKKIKCRHKISAQRAAPITRIEGMMGWTDTPAEGSAPRQRHVSGRPPQPSRPAPLPATPTWTARYTTLQAPHAWQNGGGRQKPVA